MFDNRKYVIIPSTEINNVDFSQVLETNAETCRYSVDGSQTVIKYDGEMPTSVNAISGKSQEYSHSEILGILAGEAWKKPMDDKV